MPLSSQLYDPETSERKYLNREERAAFLEATHRQEQKTKFYCQLLYYTGCRLSEALEISFERFDYEKQGVYIRTLKQKRQNGQPSQYRRFNELPESYLNEMHGFFMAMKGKRKYEVAAAEPLWPVSTRMANNYVATVMQAAGITGKKASSRGLRHSMGVMLVLEKVPVNVIGKVLGHSAIKNTLIYLDIVEDDRRQLVTQIW